MAVGAVCAGLGLGAGRRSRGRAHVALAALIVGATVLLMILDARDGVSWKSYAPLQLCDAAVGLAAWALVTRAERAFELTWFWGGAGTLPALLTPDVAEGFPHWRFLLYFVQHGGIVAAAVVLAAGGMRPRPGAVWRAFAWLNGYALLVGLVDWASGANFMYLRAKPGARTPLDWLGPWPWYLVACEVVALAFFALLALPFRRR
jgi:hypothetical integral membrane protein (TIGR02206 family)